VIASNKRYGSVRLCAKFQKLTKSLLYAQIGWSDHMKQIASDDDKIWLDLDYLGERLPEGVKDIRLPSVEPLLSNPVVSAVSEMDIRKVSNSHKQ
jgi:hypothetical protein